MESQNPLGQTTDYPELYAPDALFAIPRSDSRTTLGIGETLPFQGVDYWNAWELSWLNTAGVPQVATAEIAIPADSANLVESKSLKLYLGSFAMTRYESDNVVASVIGKDLSDCVGAEVYVAIRPPAASDHATVTRLPGACIDEQPIECSEYEVAPGLLQCDDTNSVDEALHSHLLRSLCPVTSQPDIGSVMIAYRGPRIARDSLLAYIVSYRKQQDFHEACVERIFLDIRERCKTEQLSVYARYQRRGGIDINPFRSDFESAPVNQRLWRQ